MEEQKDTSELESDDELMFEREHIVVDPGQEPLRIDKFLISKLARLSRSKVQNALKAGAILVNGENVKSNFKVKPGHEISVLVPKSTHQEDYLKPQDIPLDIVYEDDDLLVLNKEAGMVVHPGVGNRDGTLVNALLHHLLNEDIPVLEGNDANRAGLVHRLDKDTTGLMVIAKTDFAMTHLAKQFFDHTVKREYNALVWSAPDPPAGTIEKNIGRNPRDRKVQTTFEDGEDGKQAITHYETLEDLYYVSLVKCVLETGRTHQIRIHMKSVGHPIFGDTSYGGDQIRKGTVFSKYKQFVYNCLQILPRQALHARTIGFVHPTTGENMHFESALPEDFAAVLERWRKYLASRKSVE